MANRDEWVSGAEAAKIASRKSGHEVGQDYIRLLARKGKIRSKKIDGRTRAYFRPDVEEYKVRQNRSPETDEEDGAFAIAI